MSGYIVKDTGGGQEFEPVPSGLQHAVCYGLIDIGTQPQFGNYPSRRKTIMIWELPMIRGEFEKDGVKKSLPRAISEKFTASLSSKGNLRPFLESWRGREFTEDELKGFDLSKVVGANCYLNVIHKKGKGEKANRTYSNIGSISPLPHGTKSIKPENPPVVFHMDDFKGLITIPDGIPEWIQALIKQSDEYQARNGQGHQPPPNTADERSQENLDEDVPF